jgi:hypothetical protein
MGVARKLAIRTLYAKAATPAATAADPQAAAAAVQRHEKLTKELAAYREVVVTFSDAAASDFDDLIGLEQSAGNQQVIDRATSNVAADELQSAPASEDGFHRRSLVNVSSMARFFLLHRGVASLQTNLMTWVGWRACKTMLLLLQQSSLQRQPSRARP